MKLVMEVKTNRVSISVLTFIIDLIKEHLIFKSVQ